MRKTLGKLQAFYQYLSSTPEECDGYQNHGQFEKLSLSRGAYGDITTKFNVGGILEQKNYLVKIKEI